MKLNYFAVYLKLTQHYKSAILQQKILSFSIDLPPCLMKNQFTIFVCVYICSVYSITLNFVLNLHHYYTALTILPLE